jgi:transposase-like protein
LGDKEPVPLFDSSPEVIRLVVMMYVRYPLSLRRVEDLLFERGIDICHETVRPWWNRFGPMFAAEIRQSMIKQHGRPKTIVTDELRSYGAGLKALGAPELQETGR